jgi:8-oxo-dGTP pyrophosphatase MutT (NUDIX family)
MAPLQLGDAVAAIIVVDGSGYLLQLRDALAHIWYPDHWGTFGGAVDPGENEIDALRRELREELALEFADARRVSSFDFEATDVEPRKHFRTYYEIGVTSEDVGRCVLGEGAAMKVFSPDEVFGGLRLSPYDAFALFLHHASSRLVRSG